MTRWGWHGRRGASGSEYGLGVGGVALAALMAVSYAGDLIDGFVGMSREALYDLRAPTIGGSQDRSAVQFVDSGSSGPVIVRNTGGEAIEGLRVSGVEGDFTLESNDCPSRLEKKASCAVHVAGTASSSSVASNGGSLDLTGSLSLAADNADPFTLGIQGKAVEPLRFSSSGEILTWTAPSSGRYRIEAGGASGGGGYFGHGSGSGAHVSTELHVDAGEKLNFVVGDRGRGGNSGGSGGGGGGSFVFRDADDRLLLAAGGGGGGSSSRDGCAARSDLAPTRPANNRDNSCGPRDNTGGYGGSWRGDDPERWEGSNAPRYYGDGGFGGGLGNSSGDGGGGGAGGYTRGRTGGHFCCNSYGYPVHHEGGGAGGSSPSSAVPGTVNYEGQSSRGFVRIYPMF